MQHLASVRWKGKGVISGKSHLLTSDLCKWIHVSQSIEDHWRATHSLDGELPTSGITTAKGGELSSSPRCPQMPVLVSQLLPTAVSEMLISVYIIWGEKNNNTPICHFDMQIFLLMREVHHKNKPWISSYFWATDYACLCFIPQGLVDVLAWLRFSCCCSLKCFIFHRCL